MAAFTLTASGIKVADDGLVSTIRAKEAITAGQAITSDGYVVDPEDSLKLNIAGIAVTSAAIDDTVVYCYDGSITVSDTLTATRQIVAAPSGQLQYDDDLLSGDYYIIVGYTTTTGVIYMHTEDTGFIKV
jgi:hypothetical protein